MSLVKANPRVRRVGGGSGPRLALLWIMGVQASIQDKCNIETSLQTKTPKIPISAAYLYFFPLLL